MTGGDDREIHERVHELLIRRVVNTKARLVRLLRPGSLVVLGLVTVTGIGAVLKEMDVPRASFWKPDAFPGIAFAVVAGLSYLGYCFVVVGYQRVGQEVAPARSSRAARPALSPSRPTPFVASSAPAPS